MQWQVRRVGAMSELNLYVSDAWIIATWEICKYSICSTRIQNLAKDCSTQYRRHVQTTNAGLTLSSAANGVGKALPSYTPVQKKRTQGNCVILLWYCRKANSTVVEVVEGGVVFFISG